MRYYAAVDENLLIFGVGHTKKEALLDAVDWRGNNDGLEAVPCTRKLFKRVFKRGGNIVVGFGEDGKLDLLEDAHR